MNNDKWNLIDWLHHKAIHLLYDVIIVVHDWLINYACERDMWRTPEQREAEKPPKG